MRRGPRFLVRALIFVKRFGRMPNDERQNDDIPVHGTFDQNARYLYLGQKNVGSLK